MIKLTNTGAERMGTCVNIKNIARVAQCNANYVISLQPITLTAIWPRARSSRPTGCVVVTLQSGRGAAKTPDPAPLRKLCKSKKIENSEKCARCAVNFTFVANDSETGHHLRVDELSTVEKDCSERFHRQLAEFTAINHNFSQNLCKRFFFLF